LVDIRDGSGHDVSNSLSRKVFLQLTRSHFRFLSACIEGIEPRSAWSRYLSAFGDADLRTVRRHTQAIFDELQAIARRSGDPRTAALLRRDAARIPSLDPTAIGNGSALAGHTPTLEEFASEFPEGFYSEAELADLWRERFASGRQAPAVRAHRRRARLVERQLEALNRLERLARADPVPADPLTAWLPSSVCARLRRVNVRTLGELHAFTVAHGNRWYRRVPRIGPQGAQRLVTWLQAHAATLGELPTRTTTARAQLGVDSLAPPPAFGIVPLERLALPPHLDGTEGRNRAPVGRVATPAVDDLSAIRTWLAAGGRGAHTIRSYRREAERLLLWAVVERGVALSSLDAADCEAFRRFLAAPSPAWTAPRATQRWSPAWRPFEAGLSPSSIQQAETILGGLWRWLHGCGYVREDPWRPREVR